jgi:PAS domain S-box-containing protein
VEANFAEYQLRELNKRGDLKQKAVDSLKILVENFPYPAMLVGRDRKVLAANQIAQHMGAKVDGYCWHDFGHCKNVQESELIGGEDSGLCEPEKLCAFCRADEALKTNRPLHKTRCRFLGKVWDMWWVPVSKETFLHYAVDVSESIKTEAWLEEKIERRELLLDSINEGLIIQDQSAVIGFVDEKVLKTLGYTKNEFIGRTLTAFMDPSDPLIIGLPQGDVKDTMIDEEVYMIGKGGDKVRLRLVLKPMFSRNGEFRGSSVCIKEAPAKDAQSSKYSGRFQGIVGRHPLMEVLFQEIEEVSACDFPVFIQGETGTGKELIARAIHNLSDRSGELFVPVNCAALSEGIIESELFGHVKGAFTGALRDKKGRFSLADGGSIFLDEVGDLSPAVQVKLLRVLQEGTLERVGDGRTMPVDVRIISASNKDLENLMKQRKFREDLFYRLCVMQLRAPALREKTTDLPLLARHFLTSIAPKGKTGSISEEALSALMDFSWPGNVRELMNVLQYAYVKSHGNRIETDQLPAKFQKRHDTTKIAKSNGSRSRKLDEESLRHALKQTKGNKVKAAKVLGVSRATLYRFMQDSRKD